MQKEEGRHNEYKVDTVMEEEGGGSLRSSSLSFMSSISKKTDA